MEHKHALGQAFYERAADTMIGRSPEERLAVFNQLWNEYRAECASYDEHVWSYTVKMTATDHEIYVICDQVLQANTGLSLRQIVNYAKEMVKHGTNETKNAAPDAE